MTSTPGLVEGSLVLQRGRIDFLRPRDAMGPIYEQNFDAVEEYPAYWAEPWPSGVELAWAVSGLDLDGARVLELGCGLGFPGIAAALAGGRVLATDRLPDPLAFVELNARRSGAVLETAVCAWADAGPLVDRAPWDLVLAADVLYGTRNNAELLALFPRLVDGAGEVWVADPGRPWAAAFLAAARADGWTVAVGPTRVPALTILRLRRTPPSTLRA